MQNSSSSDEFLIPNAQCQPTGTSIRITFDTQTLQEFTTPSAKHSATGWRQLPVPNSEFFNLNSEPLTFLFPSKRPFVLTFQNTIQTVMF